MENVLDLNLVQQSRQGNRQAYEQLVGRHYRCILAMCVGMVSDQHEAQDLCQEAFLKGYEQLGTLRDGSLFRNWIAQIARRLCVDMIRRRQTEQRVKEGFGLLPRAETSEYSDLTTAIGKLPGEYRVPLLMYYFDGRNERVIAETLEISQSTICRRIQAARTMLYELLSENLK